MWPSGFLSQLLDEPVTPNNLGSQFGQRCAASASCMPNDQRLSKSLVHVVNEFPGATVCHLLFARRSRYRTDAGNRLQYRDLAWTNPRFAIDT